MSVDGLFSANGADASDDQVFLDSLMHDDEQAWGTTTQAAAPSEKPALSVKPTQVSTRPTEQQSPLFGWDAFDVHLEEGLIPSISNRLPSITSPAWYAFP